MLLVSGPAGIGKTHLLRAAADAARPDMVRLVARGTELEREMPFGAPLQLLEAPVRRSPELLSGAAGMSRRLFFLDPGESSFGESEGQHLLIHSLYRLVADLAARRPLALLVDDAHELDAPSLRFLAYLARRVRDLPVLLVVALRPSHPGAEAHLVKDIDPSGSSGPSYMTPFEGHLYFAANDANGQEVWRTDGTVGNAELVKDIWPGSEWSHPSGFRAIGGELYFDANDGTHGPELWKTDGTEANTEMVMDINPDSSLFGIGPSELTAFNGAIYFDANDGGHGYELWKTDGTEAGTQLVKDVNPGAGNGYPGELTVIGSRLYFEAEDGSHGYELWQTDGTEAGTVLAKDIFPGAESSYPERFAVLGNALLFAANDGSHGTELWSTAASLSSEPGSGSGSGSGSGAGPSPAPAPTPNPPGKKRHHKHGKHKGHRKHGKHKGHGKGRGKGKGHGKGKQGNHA